MLFRTVALRKKTEEFWIYIQLGTLEDRLSEGQ